MATKTSVAKYAIYDRYYQQNRYGKMKPAALATVKTLDAEFAVQRNEQTARLTELLIAAAPESNYRAVALALRVAHGLTASDSQTAINGYKATKR
jgi:hypothetical protein